MPYFVYILKSQKDGKRYIGITGNIQRRVEQHNSGQVRSTKSRIPFQLMLREEFPDRIADRNREKYFKTAVGRRYLDKLFHARMVELADTYV